MVPGILKFKAVFSIMGIADPIYESRRGVSRNARTAVVNLDSCATNKPGTLKFQA